VLVREADGRFRVVAGDGRRGFSGDGGLATRAELANISDIAFAPDGTLYLADGGRIRMIDHRGVIRTVAGNGHDNPDQSTTNGAPALSASLGSGRSTATQQPLSIAFSPTGQLCISTGFQILRLTPNGKLTTVRAAITSGPHKGQPFSGFASIAIDQRGNIDVGGLVGGWSIWQVNRHDVAHQVGFARGSGGTEPVVQRSPNGTVYGSDGAALVRIDASKLVPAFAFNQRLRGQYFALTYFAFAHDGAIYADDLPGNQGFESHQQLVKLTGHQITLLWQETNTSPGG
jgi:hypothetical protein